MFPAYTTRAGSREHLTWDDPSTCKEASVWSVHATHHLHNFWALGPFILDRYSIQDFRLHWIEIYRTETSVPDTSFLPTPVANHLHLLSVRSYPTHWPPNPNIRRPTPDLWSNVVGPPPPTNYSSSSTGSSALRSGLLPFDPPPFHISHP